MTSTITSEEFWDLLTEKITLDELKRYHEQQENIEYVTKIFTRKLEKISTVNLLKMRWKCPDRLLLELFPNVPWPTAIIAIAYKCALRGVLRTRPNIPHGRDAIEARRKLAQMHYGSKRT